MSYLRDNALAVVLGAIAFVGSHLMVEAQWSRWFGGTAEHVPYWMNSISAKPILFSCLTVGIAAAVARTLSRPQGDEFGTTILAAIATGFGATVGMILILFTRPEGPGSLFPIAFALGAGVLFVAAVLGSTAGAVIRLVSRRAKH